jgi:glucosamine-6-phosphate deaminase
LEADCEAYETAIREIGGLDFQLLGIGRNGHIGFNEPGSRQDSRTRMVVLDHVTRTDAAADFFGLENTPVRAITMGVGTILEAKEVILLATGVRKAGIVAEALEGKITSKVPASFLREHPNAHFWLDEAAAAELTMRARPWRLPDANFEDAALRRRTLATVALESGKHLADLNRDDLAAAGALRLALTESGLEKSRQIVLDEFNNAIDDGLHLPREETVLCLSPHPDDDVICCGGTLLKMNEAGNKLFVAFGVSGANAVRDKDVLTLLRARHPRLISYLEEHTEPGKSVEDVFQEIRQFIFEREPGQPDETLLRELKRLVREGEASDACRKMGAKPVFWDLPFYRDNGPVEQKDIDIALATLRRVQPDLVMLTGELNDPHGTHEKTVEAFEKATEIYLREGGKPFRRWKYRGAWDEWPVWAGSYFSLFDKGIMDQKVGLILDHISQLDPMFPGTSDPREFFERARERNRQSARDLQKLGIIPPSRSFDPVYAEVFVES